MNVIVSKNPQGYKGGINNDYVKECAGKKCTVESSEYQDGHIWYGLRESYAYWVTELLL